ncbi:DinB family protein [Chryseobacterium kwangjuense]|uniref:DinB family protein n=1 Tax=Chryseobacterium kwangjuense TaxID=267125 RepID=A0ABW9JWX9_9FLAO
MDNTLIKNLIQQLQDVENADLWIDENFNKKLALVTKQTAFIRPINNMHSVGEIISHLVEWRKEVLSRLNGNPRGLEMTDALNWRHNDELEVDGWTNLLANFRKSQNDLINFLDQKDDFYLYSKYPHADPTFPHDYLYLVNGLIHHDFYHLGQIGIAIKYLQNRVKSTS